MGLLAPATALASAITFQFSPWEVLCGSGHPMLGKCAGRTCRAKLVQDTVGSLEADAACVVWCLVAGVPVVEAKDHSRWTSIKTHLLVCCVRDVCCAMTVRCSGGVAGPFQIHQRWLLGPYYCRLRLPCLSWHSEAKHLVPGFKIAGVWPTAAARQAGLLATAGPL